VGQEASLGVRVLLLEFDRCEVPRDVQPPTQAITETERVETTWQRMRPPQRRDPATIEQRDVAKSRQ